MAEEFGRIGCYMRKRAHLLVGQTMKMITYRVRTIQSLVPYCYRPRHKLAATARHQIRAKAEDRRGRMPAAP